MLKRPDHVVTFIILFQAIGCGTTATIHKTSGEEIEATITQSDHDRLLLQDAGDVVSVSRGDIKSIDHPGNGIATLGGILAVYGAFNIALGVSKCGEKGAAFCTGVFLPVVIGLPLFISGMAIYTRSRKAAAAPLDQSEIGQPPKRNPQRSMFILPTAVRLDSGMVPALSLGGLF